MILDREKTMEALHVSVLESREQYSITADNLDEIQLVIIDEADSDLGYNFVMVENDHGTQFDLDELSDGELLIFCSEYEVEAIYDIDKTLKELKDYLISQIKPYEHEEGNDGIYIHNPNSLDHEYSKVHYIGLEGMVCIDDLDSSDETTIFHLSELYIEELIDIIEAQRV